jgi:uncharacterized protein (TIGR02266 family)
MSATRGRGERRYRRLTLQVPVTLRCLAESTTLSTFATTLGAGGLFVPGDRPLPPGTRLWVRFRLPGSDEEHALRAEVVWTNDATSPGVSAAGRGMGVAFRDPSGIARLAEALAELALEGTEEER